MSMDSEPPDLMSGLLQQAQLMQQQLLEAQAQAAAARVEGHAGGGAVRIVATGNGEFVSVHIQPDAVDPADVEMLEDLVLAALHDVTARLHELSQGAMGGLDLGGLRGLLGQ